MKKNISEKTYQISADDLSNVLLNFEDDPVWVSGWLHDYVCPDCAALLSFLPDPTVYVKDSFTCPNCGRTVSGEVYRDAWVYQYRRLFSEKLISVVFHKDRSEAIDLLIRYVDFYAAHYAKFPIHGKHVGKGKIQAQSLDEAVWAIHVLRAIYYCKEKISTEKQHEWYEKLFLPMAELLAPQVCSYQNIPLWIECCLGIIGIVFDDSELLDRALNGDYGIYNQLDNALTDDYFWNEGSPHYHYYALEGLTYFCEIYQHREPTSQLLQTLRELYIAPLRLSFDGYQLPSLNDGWYPLTIGSYASQIIRAAYITGDPEIQEQMERIRKKDGDAPFNDPAVAVTVLNSGHNIGLMLDNRIGIIRTPFQIMLKSGSVVSSHINRDTLSVLIENYSVDLGTPGYGSPLINSWYRCALAHNTYSIDGNQGGKDYLKNTVRETPDGLEAEVFGNSANGLVRAVRSLTVKGNVVIDQMIVETVEEHVFTWTFHSHRRMSCNAKLTPVSKFTDFTGAKFFEKVSKVNGTVPVRFSLDGDNGERMQILLSPTPDVQVFTAKTPGNPANEKRNTILMKTRGRKAEFIVQYRIEKLENIFSLVGKFFSNEKFKK